MLRSEVSVISLDKEVFSGSVTYSKNNVIEITKSRCETSVDEGVDWIEVQDISDNDETVKGSFNGRPVKIVVHERSNNFLDGFEVDVNYRAVQKNGSSSLVQVDLIDRVNHRLVLTDLNTRTQIELMTRHGISKMNNDGILDLCSIEDDDDDDDDDEYDDESIIFEYEDDAVENVSFDDHLKLLKGLKLSKGTQLKSAKYLQELLSKDSPEIEEDVEDDIVEEGCFGDDDNDEIPNEYSTFLKTILNSVRRSREITNTPIHDDVQPIIARYDAYRHRRANNIPTTSTVKEIIDTSFYSDTAVTDYDTDTVERILENYRWGSSYWPMENMVSDLEKKVDYFQLKNILTNKSPKLNYAELISRTNAFCKATHEILTILNPPSRSTQIVFDDPNNDMSDIAMIEWQRAEQMERNERIKRQLYILTSGEFVREAIDNENPYFFYDLRTEKKFKPISKFLQLMSEKSTNAEYYHSCLVNQYGYDDNGTYVRNTLDGSIIDIVEKDQFQITRVVGQVSDVSLEQPSKTFTNIFYQFHQMLQGVQVNELNVLYKRFLQKERSLVSMYDFFERSPPKKKEVLQQKIELLDTDAAEIKNVIKRTLENKKFANVSEEHLFEKVVQNTYHWYKYKIYKYVSSYFYNKCSGPRTINMINSFFQAQTRMPYKLWQNDDVIRTFITRIWVSSAKRIKLHVSRKDYLKSITSMPQSRMDQSKLTNDVSIKKNILFDVLEFDPSKKRRIAVSASSSYATGDTEFLRVLAEQAETRPVYINEFDLRSEEYTCFMNNITRYFLKNEVKREKNAMPHAWKHLSKDVENVIEKWNSVVFIGDIPEKLKDDIRETLISFQKNKEFLSKNAKTTWYKLLRLLESKTQRTNEFQTSVRAYMQNHTQMCGQFTDVQSRGLIHREQAERDEREAQRFVNRSDDAIAREQRLRAQGTYIIGQSQQFGRQDIDLNESADTGLVDLNDYNSEDEE